MSFIQVITSMVGQDVMPDVSISSKPRGDVTPGSVLTLLGSAPCCDDDKILESLDGLRARLDFKGKLVFLVDNDGLPMIGAIVKILGAISGIGRIIGDAHDDFWREVKRMSSLQDNSGTRSMSDEEALVGAYEIHMRMYDDDECRSAKYNHDITPRVMRSMEVIEEVIYRSRETSIAIGRDAVMRDIELSITTLIDNDDSGIITRVSHLPVSHLFSGNKGIASYNTLTGTITLALEHPVGNISCINIARELWGSASGGWRKASSRAGLRMGLTDLDSAAWVFRFVLSGMSIEEARQSARALINESLDSRSDRSVL